MYEPVLSLHASSPPLCGAAPFPRSASSAPSHAVSSARALAAAAVRKKRKHKKLQNHNTMTSLFFLLRHFYPGYKHILVHSHSLTQSHRHTLGPELWGHVMSSQVESWCLAVHWEANPSGNPERAHRLWAKDFFL